jgi:DNA processing protein
MSDEILYEVALSHIDGVGSVIYRQLVNAVGSAEEVLKSSPAKLLKIPNIGKVAISKLQNASEALHAAEIILKKNEKYGIRVVNFKNPEYPKRLLQLFDAPPILYMKGKGESNHPKTLAIVGTREASTYGKESVEQIISGLKDINVQIISGLAYGIDIASHKSSLKNNVSTIGVLANSLEGVYPEAHFKTAQEMLENGLLISEQPVGTKTKTQFFVARNRIIAGMADAVIVVESAKKGGSMVTATYANNYNKEVFAIPGGIFQKFSEGPNYLISNQLAQIFTDIPSFLTWMNWQDGDAVAFKTEQKIEMDLSKFTQDESAVVSLLVQKGEMMIDEISWQTQIHLNKLASVLLNLEFQDVIKQKAGKKFSLKK